MAEKRPPPGVEQHPSAPRVPGYLLTLPLARGASSEVWKAWQERTGKEVALKVLRGLGDDQRANLRASVERLIRLDRHPNVVAVLDADLAGEPAWVATDLLESGSLQTRIDSGRPASSDEAARWLEDAARALTYVHGRGVFHGNIKPSNILVDEEGRPRLLDFGGGGDVRSDAAALAAAVRTAMAGSAPDEDLAAVLGRCEAPENEPHYRSMAELTADLEARRKQLPVAPLAGGRLYRARLFVRRNRAATALAALLLGAVVWGVAAVASRNAALTRELAAAYSQRARTALLLGEPAAAAVLFAKSNLLHPTDAARRDAVGVLSQLAAPRSVLTLGTPVEAVAASPDGSRVFGVAHHAAGLFDPGSGTNLIAPRRSLSVASLFNSGLYAEFSRDGARVLTFDSENVLQLRDARSGAMVAEFPGVSGVLSSRGLVAAARLKADGWDYVPVDLYDAATGRPTGVTVRHALKDKGNAVAVAFSPDGTRLLTSGGSVLRLWDPATGRQVGRDVAVRPPPTPGMVSFIVALGSPRAGFTGEGLRAWAIDGDDVILLDAGSGEAFAAPLRLEDSVKAFAADRGLIVTGSSDGSVRLWRGSNPTAAPPNPAFRHTGRVNAVALDASRGLAASAGEDGTVRFWKVSPWGPTGPILPHGGPVTSLAFTADGRSLVTGAKDGQVRVWDVPDPAGDEIVLEASEAAVLPGGKRVVSYKHGRDLELRSLPGAETLGQGLTGGPVEGLGTVRTDASGSRVLLAPGGSDAVWVVDAGTGRRIAGPLRHPYAPGEDRSRFFPLEADISPDGRLAATASTDGKIRLWDVDRGVEARESIPAPSSFGTLLFSPEGKRLAVVQYDKTEVWSVPPGKAPLVTIPGGGWEAVWTPDGRRLATSDGEERRVTVWDAATGEPAGPPIQFSDSTQILVASPDSRRLAVGFDGGTVRLVNPENAEIVGPPLRHAKDARAAGFTADSTVLATAGLDGTVHLWDAATGEPTARPLWMGRVITSLAFSQDGRSLATGGSWELRLWDVSWLGSKDGPGELSRRAEETARLRIDERGAPKALPPPEK